MPVITCLEVRIVVSTFALDCFSVSFSSFIDPPLSSHLGSSSIETKQWIQWLRILESISTCCVTWAQRPTRLPLLIPQQLLVPFEVMNWEHHVQRRPRAVTVQNKSMVSSDPSYIIWNFYCVSSLSLYSSCSVVCHCMAGWYSCSSGRGGYCETRHD